jgi:hypothetical protein
MVQVLHYSALPPTLRSWVFYRRRYITMVSSQAHENSFPKATGSVGAYFCIAASKELTISSTTRRANSAFNTLSQLTGYQDCILHTNEVLRLETDCVAVLSRPISTPLSGVIAVFAEAGGKMKHTRLKWSVRIFLKILQMAELRKKKSRFCPSRHRLGCRCLRVPSLIAELVWYIAAVWVNPSTFQFFKPCISQTIRKSSPGPWTEL